MIINPYVFAAAGFGSPVMTNLEFWADTYQEVGFSDNDQMAALQDWSGNNRDGTGVTAGGTKPIYKATAGPNSRPCIRYSTNGAASGYFTLPNFLTGFTAGHCFVVTKNVFSAGTGSAVPLTQWGSAGDGYYIWDGNSHIYDTFGTNTRKDNITPVVTVSNWHVYEVRTAAGAWSLYQDGNLATGPLGNTVGWGTAPQIGFESAAGRYYVGDQAEILFYSAVLGAGDIQTNYNYLEAKYLITMP